MCVSIGKLLISTGFKTDEKTRPEGRRTSAFCRGSPTPALPFCSGNNKSVHLSSKKKKIRTRVYTVTLNVEKISFIKWSTRISTIAMTFVEESANVVLHSHVTPVPPCSKLLSRKKQKEIAPSHICATLCVGQLPVYTGGTGTVNNEWTTKWTSLLWKLAAVIPCTTLRAYIEFHWVAPLTVTHFCPVFAPN